MGIIGINSIPYHNTHTQQKNKLKRTIQEETKSSINDNTNTILTNKKTKQNKFYEMQENNKYDNNISGPFIVQITARNESQNLGNLHPLQLGKKIAPLATQLQKINKLGKDKIQLTFNNHIHANEFVDQAKIKLTEWYTYIPDYKIQRRIVVYDIPKEMDIDDIKQGIEEHEANPEVLEIERLMRCDKGSDKLIPTNAIKIVIKGDSLPQNITIWYVKCKVAPIKKSLKKCNRCLRYGPISSQCRGQKRCANCTEMEHQDIEECKATAKCYNCKGNHKIFDINCPSLQYQKILATTMSYYNIDHKKAKETIRKNNILSESQIIGLYYKEINKRALYNWNEKQFLSPITPEKIEVAKPRIIESATEENINNNIANTNKNIEDIILTTPRNQSLIGRKTYEDKDSNTKLEEAHIKTAYSNKNFPYPRKGNITSNKTHTLITSVNPKIKGIAKNNNSNENKKLLSEGKIRSRTLEDITNSNISKTL